MKRLDQSFSWKEFMKNITGKTEEDININILTISSTGQLIKKENKK